MRFSSCERRPLQATLGKNEGTVAHTQHHIEIEELTASGSDPLKRDFPFTLWNGSIYVIGLVIAIVLTVIIVLGNVWLAAVAPEIAAAHDYILPFMGWDEIVLILLISYIATANESLRTQFIHDYLVLRPALEASVERRREILMPLIAHRGRNRALTSLVVVILALPILTDVFAAAPDHPIGYGVLMFRITVLMWVIGAALYDSYDSNRRMMKLMREGLRINLFDTEPLRAITRSGVRASVAIAIGCALAAPLLAEETALVATVILLSINLSVAFVVLYFPARAVRSIIAQTKQNTKDELDAMISETWERARGKDENDARRARAELGGLTGLHARVDQVSEWPYGAPTIARLIVFGLLPVGSWVAAALVENFVQDFVG